MSYTIIPYIREKFEHIRLSFQSLFNMPKDMEVPFLTYQQFGNLIGSVVPMMLRISPAASADSISTSSTMDLDSSL